MNPLYRHVLLPPVRLITRHDAEIAMDWHIQSMKLVQRSPLLLKGLARRHRAADPALRQTLMNGLVFPHPVGIAAGLDKSAAVYPALQAHHSPAFIEVGTVTLRGQAGNPRPRISRVGRDGLINAMGFPNGGAEVVGEHLATLPRPMTPLGLNIGKLKNTPDENAAEEYGDIIRYFNDSTRLVDYYVINVSSPNTPGLRALQGSDQLSLILTSATEAIDQQPHLGDRPRRRLLVKLAPDLTPRDLESIIELVLSHDIGGLVLTNTKPTDRPGGLSGSSLYDLSSALVRTAARLLPLDRVIVATGGMDTVERAYEMLHYADLIGVYTGLVLKGPALLRHLSDGVSRRMAADGVASLSELRSRNRPAT